MADGDLVVLTWHLDVPEPDDPATTYVACSFDMFRYDADGREIDRYHLHPPSAHFVDLANTLDYSRGTGLQPFTDEAKKPVAAGKK